MTEKTDEGAHLEESFASNGSIKIFRILLNAVSIILIIGIGVVAGNKFAAMKKPAAKKPPESRALKVQVMNTAFGQHTVALSGKGTVAAKSQLNIIPEVSGKLGYVHPEFREGGFVKSGEVLFKVDQADYIERRNQILASIDSYKSDIQMQNSQYDSLHRESAEAKKTWEVSNVETERIRRLVERGAASEAELNRMLLSERSSLERIEAYESRIDLIEPSIQKLEAAIAVQNAQLATVNLSIDRTIYKAPFTGIVSGAGYKKGQFIGAGQVIAMLMDESIYEIPVPLSVSDFRMLGVGNDSRDLLKTPGVVEVIWKDNNGSKQASWKGEIVRLGSALDAGTKLLNVIVEVREESMREGMKLMPGMYVDVKFTGKTLDNVALLPRRALRRDNEVYIVRDEKLEVRAVDVWGRTGNDFIVSGGLEAGALVITSVVDEPTPGIPVTVLSK